MCKRFIGGNACEEQGKTTREPFKHNIDLTSVKEESNQKRLSSEQSSLSCLLEAEISQL
jgi:hypothetical protein